MSADADRLHAAHAAEKKRADEADDDAMRWATIAQDHRRALEGAKELINQSLKAPDNYPSGVAAHRVALDAANEEIVRLKAQNNHIADERDRNVADKVATTAKLGRTVAALQAVAHLNRSAVDDNEGAWGLESEMQRDIDAILADAENKAAGEAYAKLLIEAMHMLCYVDAHMNERVAVAEKLAKASGHPWPPYPDAKDDEDDADGDT